MTGFNHILAGSIIALAVKEPTLIVPIAFASHFVMDATPHFGNHPKMPLYNKAFMNYLKFDAFMSILVLITAISLSPENWFIILLGAGFAILPDVTWPFINKAPAWSKWFYKFHKGIQWAEVPHGWIYETFYFLLGLALLFAVAQ